MTVQKLYILIQDYTQIFPHREYNVFVFILWPRYYRYTNLSEADEITS